MFRSGWLLLAILVTVFFAVYANPDAEDLYHRGVQCLEKKEYEEALRCFRKVTTEHSYSYWTIASRDKLKEISLMIASRQSRRWQPPEIEPPLNSDFWKERGEKHSLDRAIELPMPSRRK